MKRTASLVLLALAPFAAPVDYLRVHAASP